ncbi:WhiB family transcriptional regulator [Streptomyces ramulosus]
MTRIVPVRITKTPPATALPATSNWRARGACRGEDPDLFFPVGKNRHQVAQAKAVCARCPVSATCLAWALETCQADGIWGGMDARDRVLGRRGLRRAARDAA